jgi:hypothetical protein
MTPNDFEDLADHLRAQFLKSGLNELADPAAYLFRDRKDGSLVRMRPRNEVVAMLKAFDAYLALESKETIQSALEVLRAHGQEGGPSTLRALVMPTRREGEEDTFSPERIDATDLAQLPNRDSTRIRVRELVAQLVEMGG